MIVSISKGYQLTIPAELRNELDITAGSRVDVTKIKDRIIIRPMQTDIDDIFQESKRIKPKHNLTARQMDSLIENAIH